jgi:predicted dithiol-disulfide oxidoreductase (DUF899 family)
MKTFPESKTPEIVSHQEWLAARRALLRKEKAFTHQREALTAERMQLPWERVEKEYAFEGPEGRITLADLFDGRGQLIIYHFMFGPGWKEGCVGCSLLCDGMDGALPHLRAHDVSLAVVSRAPLAELMRFRQRMGWKFPWVSSHDSDFNHDYHVSFTSEQMAAGRGQYNFEEDDLEIDELSGTSVFTRNPQGEIFHTYSAYARGDEQLLTVYHYLELTPLGRNEHGPRGNLSDWVRHHDRYGAGGTVAGTGRYLPPDEALRTDCGCSAG